MSVFGKMVAQQPAAQPVASADPLQQADAVLIAESLNAATQSTHQDPPESIGEASAEGTTLEAAPVQEATQEATQEAPSQEAGATAEATQEATQEDTATLQGEQTLESATQQDETQQAVTQEETSEATVTLEAPVQEATQEATQEAGETAQAQVIEQQEEASAESATQEAAPTLEADQTAEATQEDAATQEAAPVAQASEQTQEAYVPQMALIRRAPSAKTHGALARMDQMRKHDRRVANLKSHLQDFSMIESYRAVAKEHNLSVPLVAAFRATPGFEQAVQNFPKTDLFNIVAEHQSSARNSLGLESLDMAETQTADVLKDDTSSVVLSFGDVLTGLDTTIENLLEQVSEDKADLEALDISDDVLASLPVYTLSDTAFIEAFTKLEEYLKTVDVFNVDELRAHPESMGDELDSVVKMVDDLGGVLGMKLEAYGLGDDDKAEAFEPTQGEFGSKSITKTGLIFLLDKATAVLEALKSVADRKEELMASTTSAVEQMPQTYTTNDVTYGRVEHVTLLSCYTTLVTKLIREAVVLVSMLLSSVDAVLDVDMGDSDPV